MVAAESGIASFFLLATLPVFLLTVVQLCFFLLTVAQLCFCVLVPNSQYGAA